MCSSHNKTHPESSRCIARIHTHGGQYDARADDRTVDSAARHHHRSPVAIATVGAQSAVPLFAGDCAADCLLRSGRHFRTFLLRSVRDAGASLVHSVSLYQFGDKSSLDNALNSALHKTYIKGSKPQACPGLSSVPQAWHHAATPDKTEGQIGCLWANDAIETPYLYWTSNAQLVFGELEDVSNLDVLYRWWLANYGT